MAGVKDMKVAILVADGFEQDELLKPRKALDEAGADTRVVSPNDETVRGWNDTNWGATVKVDDRLNEAKPDRYDALLLPGGAINPDELRMQPKAVEFVRAFFESGKPVAAICHGPWSIIEAGEARGRKIASWPSIKTDLRNAGAEWLDREAVVDGNLVSARKPDDIPAFNRAMIDVFGRAKEQPPRTEGERDPRHHTQNIKRMLNDVVAHTREDVRKISDPKAQALFETTAETIYGLIKAYDDFAAKPEDAWRKTGGSV